MSSTRKALLWLGLLAVLAISLAGCTQLAGLQNTTSPQGLVSQTSTSQFQFVNGKAKVFIGFTHRPGAADQALVRQAGGQIKYTYDIVPAIAATLPEAAITALSHNPNVSYIEPDGQVQAIGTVDYQTELDKSWGVKQIGAGTVQASGDTGSGIKIAILDTGMDYNHPDLAANYQGGYNYVAGNDDPMDDNGHGTHVAGIIGALRNGIGVVGVAPSAELYAVKVLNASGSGSWSDVIAGLQWAVSNGMNIVNMSLGGTGSTTLQQACLKAYNDGILLVAAAGNSGNRPGKGDNIEAPAEYKSVIAVGATDQQDQRAYFSSTGSALELMAPGVEIYSTYLNDTYATMSGTSMASPHVAGTAALVWSEHPTWTNLEVRNQLTATADDLGATGWDPLYGYGIVNAVQAVGVSVPTVDMHVSAIDMSLSTKKNSAQGVATVTIEDASGNPVSGATVTGDWSGNVSGSASGTTNSSGVVSLKSPNVRKPASGTTFTITVTGVTASGYTYDATQDVVTSGSISTP